MRRTRTLILIALALLTVAAYARAPWLPFISVDDPAYVTANPNVQAGLTASGVRWAFTTTSQANWHPLTWLSLMADATIGGSSPGVYHVTNVVLHLLGTLLLFLVFERATGAAGASAFVAALFAIHPLHVESVAWVAERKDVLSGVFWMLTLLAYVRYAAQPKVGRYALVALCMALGLMAKPMLVTIPLVLLLFDVWPLARWPETGARRLVAEKVPLLALSAASGWITVVAQGSAIRDFSTFSLSDRVANALVSSVLYAVKMIWPRDLAAYYPYPANGFPVMEGVLAAAVLAAVTFAAIRGFRTRPWIAFGWAWYLITLLPVIGIVQIGSQAMADRYTYIPLIGLFVIACWEAASLLPARALRVASGVVLVTLTALTWHQLGYWRSTIALFSHAAAVTEDNAAAHATLASALAREGRAAEARFHLKRALELGRGVTDVHFDRTRLAIGGGQLEEAAFLVGLELEVWPKDPRGYVNAGLLEMKHDRYDTAITRFEEALRLDPDSVDALLNLGSIRAAQGRTDEAIAHFEHVLRVAPNDPDATRVLAELRARRP